MDKRIKTQVASTTFWNFIEKMEGVVAETKKVKHYYGH